MKDKNTPKPNTISWGRFALGIALSALSGMMLLLAFPPYGIWPLAWVAFIPAIFAQYRLLPLKFANMAMSLILLVWLGPYLARLFGDVAGPFFTYLGAFIALIAFFTYKERAFIERTGYRWLILQGAIGWVGFEMVRATFIPVIATSAFIGYSQATQAWLLQPVAIFSVYGLNLVMMLVNYTLGQGLIAWYDHRSRTPTIQAVNLAATRKWLAVTGVILIVWIGISLIILSGAPRDAETVRVAAIRPNYAAPAHHDEVNTSPVRLERFVSLAREAAEQGAKILVTPEMLFNFDPREQYTQELRDLAAETNTYQFLSYSVLVEGEPRRNQTVLLSPDGQFSEAYQKTHIPPGERYDIPRGIFPVFDTTIAQLAALICHDGNYTDVSRMLTRNGAQLIAAGFFEFSGFGEQLWTNTTFRAVENHTAVVVAGATSVSAIIDPYGRQVALDVDIDGSEVILVGDVSLGDGSGTFYTKTGDVLGWLMLTGMVAFIIYMAINGRQTKQATRKEDL